VTQPQQIVEVLRKADLVSMVKSIQPVVGSVGAPALKEFEGVIGFVERFVPMLERVSKSIMEMRKFENGGMVDDGDGDGGDWIDSAPQPAPSQARAPTAVGPSAEPAAASAEPVQIEPLRVFQKLLGSLSQLDQDITVAQALELARTNKALIMPQIKAAIAELSAPPKEGGVQVTQGE